jgi:hypothetical protein
LLVVVIKLPRITISRGSDMRAKIRPNVAVPSAAVQFFTNGGVTPYSQPGDAYWVLSQLPLCSPYLSQKQQLFALSPALRLSSRGRPNSRVTSRYFAIGDTCS